MTHYEKEQKKSSFFTRKKVQVLKEGITAFLSKKKILWE